jgi:hypothetical protein
LSAIETLCDIIAQRGKASKPSYKSKAGFSALEQARLICDDGKVQSVLCDACDDPHSAAVIFEGGTYGHFCPDAGFVKLAPQRIKATKADVGNLVSALSEVLSCKRRKSTPISGETWRVGGLDTSDGQLAVYFHPVLRDERDAKDLRNALASEMRSQFRLVLTAAGTLAIDGANIALLADVFEVSDADGSLALSMDPRQIVGAQDQSSPGRPSLYKDNLRALILERIAEGKALPGRNAEARALRDIYPEKYPEKTSPSLPTIQKHLTKIRAGS